MAGREETRTRFLKELGRPFIYEDLFDAVADTVFFVKDAAGRYVAVNRTLATRTGRASKDELIGLTATEAFPGMLGELIAEQDRSVLSEGQPINGKLELHLYPGGAEGWCLTWKSPILGRDNGIVGLSGLSRDLQTLASPTADMAGMSRLIDYVHRNIDKPLLTAELADRANLSAYQLDVRIRSLFGLSIRQYLVRARVELACSRLRHTAHPISRIALDCGYGDQAAFTRQFRKSVGLTPWQYQQHHRLRAAGDGSEPSEPGP